MLFNGTVQRVIAPLVREGHPVHVYISLVDVADDHPYQAIRRREREVPATVNLTWMQLQQHYAQMVAEVGGCLVCFSISGESESLPKISTEFPWSQRMRQYPPQKSSIGRNVLRLWKSREQLWEHGNVAEKELRVQYSLVMWVRDDTHWVGDLGSMTGLLTSVNVTRTLWTKNCKEFYGINDKVALMGRQAADVMLRAWSSYQQPVPALESLNAEQFLLRLAQSRHLDLIKLEQKTLPSGDAMYVGGDEAICLVRKYWCGQESEHFC